MRRFPEVRLGRDGINCQNEDNGLSDKDTHTQTHTRAHTHVNTPIEFDGSIAAGDNAKQAFKYLSIKRVKS